MAQAKKEYRALNGFNWVEGEGEDAVEHRVEANDKLTDLPENVIKHEVAGGNLEVWKDRQTENVKDHESNSWVYGVTTNSKGELESFQEGKDPFVEEGVAE